MAPQVDLRFRFREKPNLAHKPCVRTDKAKSPAPSTGDKKAKKGNDDQGSQVRYIIYLIQFNLITVWPALDETNFQERLKKSPSHHKELQPRYSSTSLQKHSSVDDASATVKTRSAVSISKSSSDVARSAASGEDLTAIARPCFRQRWS